MARVWGDKSLGYTSLGGSSLGGTSLDGTNSAVPIRVQHWGV